MVKCYVTVFPVLFQTLGYCCKEKLLGALLGVENCSSSYIEIYYPDEEMDIDLSILFKQLYSIWVMVDIDDDAPGAIVAAKLLLEYFRMLKLIGWGLLWHSFSLNVLEILFLDVEFPFASSLTCWRTCAFFAFKRNGIWSPFPSVSPRADSIEFSGDRITTQETTRCSVEFLMVMALSVIWSQGEFGILSLFFSELSGIHISANVRPAYPEMRMVPQVCGHLRELLQLPWMTSGWTPQWTRRMRKTNFPRYIFRWRRQCWRLSAWWTRNSSWTRQSIASAAAQQLLLWWSRYSFILTSFSNFLLFTVRYVDILSLQTSVLEELHIMYNPKTCCWVSFFCWGRGLEPGLPRVFK